MVVSISTPYIVAAVGGAVVAMTWLSKRPNLNVFPTVGSSSWLGSWWAGARFMINAADVVHEGYEKYRGAPFKIATLFRWMVIVTGRPHIEELRNARDDEFSLSAAFNEDYGFEYTMGHEVVNNPYHNTVLRSQFTRNIGAIYHGLKEEIVTTFDEVLDLKGNEWKGIPALTTVQQVVCRASNRAFVGLPLCRNPDYVDLNKQHTADFVKGSLIISFFPKFLKPLAARLVTKLPRNTNRAVDHLRPLIEERRRYLHEYGKDWNEKPHDLLSCLMDEGGLDATIEDLTGRILTANFSSTQTLSNVFTHALYNLAANPQFLQPLREEVEAIIGQEDWSKGSLSKMRKVDSFLKESIRMNGGDIFGLIRNTQKDFTFSDGTFIPKGTRIGVGLVALHNDGALYENPKVFDPFRFANMGAEDEVEGAKHQLVATSAEWLSFGYGRHACPGRFFAGVELKTMLAHVVATYDIKLEDNMPRPRSSRLGSLVKPNSKVEVMFRKRVHKGNIDS